MKPGISTRLTAPLIAVSVLLLGVGIGAAWYVRNLQHNTSEIVSNHMASVRAAYELEISIREVRRQFFRFLFDGNRQHLEPVPLLRQEIDRWLGEAERLGNTPIEQEHMRHVRHGYEQFFVEYDRLTSNAPPQGAYDRFHEGIDALVTTEFLQPAIEYQKVNEATLARVSQENQELADRLIVGLVVLGVCGAAGGLLMGWGIAHSVRRSINRTEQHLRTTAQQLNRVAGAPNTASESLTGTGELDAAVHSVSSSVAAVLKRLDRSERDALRAEQLAYVGQMAAGIAHEVRNPLMAIKILIQKASEQPAAKPVPPRDLRVLEAEIERLEQIVTHFLEFARPPRIEKRIVEARSLLKRILNSLSVRAEQQEVCLKYNLLSEPVFLDVDAGQFQQVLANLVINALDALPSGGNVTIDTMLEQRNSETKPMAVIRVEDDGAGLPADLGERIFEPFISSKESGLGLGLSICRRIVEAHGGSLHGENRLGGGAVFMVRLPAITEPALVLQS